MIGYVTVGTNDLERAGRFYDAIAAEMGGKRVMATDRMILWASPAGAMLGAIKPYDGAAACIGNGVMVALKGADRAQVDKVHAVALANGGSDEGPAGERMAGFYAAYFRDPDGNKLNIYVQG